MKKQKMAKVLSMVIAISIIAMVFTGCGSTQVEYTTYEVQEGDTIFDISKDISNETKYEFEFVVTCIEDKNSLDVNKPLTPGTIIYIPTR